MGDELRAKDEGERIRFVFGGAVDRATWLEADPGDRRAMIAKQFDGLGEAQLWLRSLVVEQLVGGNPPEVWETAQRLAADGIAADAVLNQLAMVLAHTASEGVERDVIDMDAYRAALGRLPLPGGPDIADALLEIAAAAVVLPSGDLIARATKALGYEGDDRIMVHLVERVEEDLADGFGPLAWVARDRTVHVEALCAGIVLTHVLTEAERSIGMLMVSFDLAGFARVDELTFDGDQIEAVSPASGLVAWAGPDGWLERFDAGRTLAVRVDRDGMLGLQPLPGAPPVDAGLVAAVRRVYDEAVEEPQLPVSGEELILGLLADDRTTFARPQATLSDLCHAAGLDKRASAVGHDPEVWSNLRQAGRIQRVLRDAGGDTDLAEQALDVITLLDDLDGGTDIEAERVREALGALGDLDVLFLVIEEVFNPDAPDCLVRADAVTGRLVEAAASPAQRATARLVAAHAAEAAGGWATAEQHLELAAEADPRCVPAVDRLAWYASDRGDAARAVRLWRSCPRSATVAQDLATVEPFTRPAVSSLGRNDRCWCGSGRKYKLCHLEVPAPAPLPDRVGWLCRKAVGYLERVGADARAAVLDVVDARIGEHDDLAAVMGDPLVMDLVLTEGGWFDRFLADRGQLLPDDEALLASAWMTVERTVYEVTSTRPGAGMTVRDLRTGDEIDVRERTFSKVARVGMLLCARAVPDGETHQFVGGLFPVTPGTETALIDLLDEGDPYEIAAWARDLRRAPELRTRENEPLVECEIEVTTDDLDRLVAHLDATYENDAPGEWWTEHHDLDDLEGVVRASFHLDGDRLTITTNSNERADRILGRLHAGLDVTVLADVRTPVSVDAIRRSQQTGLPDLRSLAARTAPTLGGDATAKIQEQMEDRWCAESVPALGGLTPLQAAADPTRRQQLRRLLDSFDAQPTPPGAFTMRTDRLRALLGL